MIPFITIIGAAHHDRIIRLSGEAKWHRTNPASQETRAGGVAANMARHLAQQTKKQPQKIKIQFIGVSTKDEIDHLSQEISALGIKTRLTAIDAPTPSYTAVLDAAGELVIGAACMDLYDAVTMDALAGYLPQTGSVIIDANFPQDVISALAEQLPLPMSLFAAATSIEKVTRLAPILSRLDGLVMNVAEAKVLSDQNTVAGMAEAISQKMRPRAFVLVSDGGGDAALSQSGQTVTLRPKPLQDDINANMNGANMNGAGDAMAAQLFLRYCQMPIAAKPSTAALQTYLQDALDAGHSYILRSMA